MKKMLLCYVFFIGILFLLPAIWTLNNPNKDSFKDWKMKREENKKSETNIERQIGR